MGRQRRQRNQECREGAAPELQHQQPPRRDTRQLSSCRLVTAPHHQVFKRRRYGREGGICIREHFGHLFITVYSTSIFSQPA